MNTFQNRRLGPRSVALRNCCPLVRRVAPLRHRWLRGGRRWQSKPILAAPRSTFFSLTTNRQGVASGITQRHGLFDPAAAFHMC